MGRLAHEVVDRLTPSTRGRLLTRLLTLREQRHHGERGYVIHGRTRAVISNGRSRGRGGPGDASILDHTLEGANPRSEGPTSLCLRQLGVRGTQIATQLPSSGVE